MNQLGAFCTIVTKDYLHFALRLFRSLQEHAKNDKPRLYVFVVDELEDDFIEKAEKFGGTGLIVWGKKQLLASSESARKTFDTFALEKGSMLRWALKPVVMQLVLEKHPNTYFLDPDLCFFGDYSFLWSYFEDSQIILSPHWREIDPRRTGSTAQISLNYKHGIFNGGFVGASHKAGDFLSWWNASCLALPEFENRKHTHDDQKFLDLVPVYFEKVHILKHYGCNVSEWNETYVSREYVDGQVVLNHRDLLVFAHFANSYELAIEEGRDPLMSALYVKWKEELQIMRQNLESQEILNLPKKEKQPGVLAKKAPWKPTWHIKQWVYKGALKVVKRVEK